MLAKRAVAALRASQSQVGGRSSGRRTGNGVRFGCGVGRGSLSGRLSGPDGVHPVPESRLGGGSGADRARRATDRGASGWKVARGRVPVPLELSLDRRAVRRFCRYVVKDTFTNYYYY